MTEESFRNLRFDRRSQPIPRRLIGIGSTLAIFTLLWVLVPHSGLYWLLLLLVALLSGAASFGWRQALTALHDWLHRVGNF